MRKFRSKIVALICLGMTAGAPLAADELRVAVASNFHAPMNDIAERFSASTGHPVLISAGATGKHYAQIVNGAPFDLFFAADAERPQRLEAEGHALAGSRFTYAVGRLVLWSPDPDLVEPGGAVLNSGEFRFLAIANPALAPYGSAARQVLEGLGAWDTLEGRLVRGENIGQAYQFVRSGNADLGLVAASQLSGMKGDRPGSSWPVPGEMHGPIVQQAVVLRESGLARDFAAFVRSEPVLRLIEEYGYLRP